MGKYKVIDVSYWNKGLSTSNYKSLKKKGIQAVIARCGYDIDNKDSTFDDHISRAKSAGLKVGAYWYSCAKTESQAEKEAANAVKFCKGKGLTYPIFYDVEDSKTIGELSKSEIAKLIKAFCNAVEKEGFQSGVYASLSWLNGKIDDFNENTWVAQYNETCDYKGKKIGWQYSSTYKPSGISHVLDVSWFYKDYPVKSVPAPSPTPSSAPTKKSYSGKIDLPVRGYFKKGDKGAKVKTLQKALNWEGHSLYVDGILGDKTVSAVEGFEKKYHLKVDGKFGKSCLKEFKSIKK